MKYYGFEEEEIVVCGYCGCEENVEEMRDGMCPDCYEEYLEECEEDEEE